MLLFKNEDCVDKSVVNEESRSVTTLDKFLNTL